MTKEKYDSMYFSWLCGFITDPLYQRDLLSYQLLLRSLHQTPFIAINPRDINRLTDGNQLRRRFLKEHEIFDGDIYEEIINGNSHGASPCSVLEMMAALAIRCESSIMSCPDIGDRTSLWFWEMVESLGLDDMDDEHFNSRETLGIVHRFLLQEYLENGKGGLFYIPNYEGDIRDLEIWYQMCAYLTKFA